MGPGERLACSRRKAGERKCIKTNGNALKKELRNLLPLLKRKPVRSTLGSSVKKQNWSAESNEVENTRETGCAHKHKHKHTKEKKEFKENGPSTQSLRQHCFLHFFYLSSSLFKE